MTEALRCEGCGKTMEEHDRLLRCGEEPAADVPEHFIAQLRDASRYLLQNGQTKQGLAVQACITMLEDDSE